MLIERFMLNKISIAGISAHTLRYYEKKGLLRVGRDNARRRDYSEDDIEWALFRSALSGRRFNAVTDGVAGSAQEIGSRGTEKVGFVLTEFG